MKVIILVLSSIFFSHICYCQTEEQKKIKELEKRVEKLENIVSSKQTNIAKSKFKIQYEVLCTDSVAKILIGYYDRNEKYNGVWGKSKWKYNFESINPDQNISISASSPQGKEVTVKIYVDGQLRKSDTQKGETQAFAQVILNDK